MKKDLVLSPQRSVEFIVNTARDVVINKEEIVRLGDELIEDFKNDPTPLIDDNDPACVPPFDYLHVLDWLFVVNVLNFGYHSRKTGKEWKAFNRTGYLAICTAINRVVKKGYNVVRPSFYAQISSRSLFSLLRGTGPEDTNISFFDERMEALRSSGRTLMKYYGGSFKNCLLQSKRSAIELVNILTSRFEYFVDEVEFNGKTVTFHRKAQLLAINVWAFYKRNGIDYFNDVHELITTTGPELPQLFLYYNIFSYSHPLEKRILRWENLPYGHHDETEIRGCTIHVLKILKDYISKHLNNETYLNPLFVNDLLTKKWISVSDKVLEAKFKYHLANCVFY
ncbi:hypothetical protein ILUMI_03682 [Ignelater luminosus]|uniref:Queuosine 5'-phosphate N-glycosylase/hydrolase n=1 Tax=Ignelater luminosus TaxID=2038154 RepID=A0A8K0DE66_IGNLU|nr:hypothetical protein ILUMI_03682 [Ignelater luminosus]